VWYHRAASQRKEQLPRLKREIIRNLDELMHNNVYDIVKTFVRTVGIARKNQTVTKTKKASTALSIIFQYDFKKKSLKSS